MIQSGHFHVERSIFKYAKKPFTEMEAMLWLIASAGFNGNEKGRVLIGTRALSVEWGWSRSKVHRQLRLWGKSGFISLQKRVNLLSEPVAGAVDRTCYLDLSCNEIYLPNYSQKQAHKKTDRTCSTDLLSEPVAEPVDRTVLKENTEIKNNPLLFPLKGVVQKKAKAFPILKTAEEICRALKSVDLTKAKATWEPHGVDVQDVWLIFQETCLSGTPKKPFLNPYGYRDMNRAFNDWCRRRKEKGPTLTTPGTKPKTEKPTLDPQTVLNDYMAERYPKQEPE